MEYVMFEGGTNRADYHGNISKVYFWSVIISLGIVNVDLIYAML